MTNSKTTKRALLTSAMAILVCVAMLIGTTFAWFTDTATASVNKIQSGTLNVEIQNEDGTEITTLAWLDSNGSALPENYALWEPGCTYKLTPFKIANKGNLALKYKIVISGLEGDADLLRVISFTYTTGTNTPVDMNAVGHLAANYASDLITVTAHMDEAAGNEYQNKTLSNVSFTVYATQDTVESDSFNNQYDANAKLTVTNAADLAEAVTKSGTYCITQNLTLDEMITVTNTDVTLNATGHTINNVQDIWDDNTFALVSAVGEKTNLTIDGGNFHAKENDCFAVDVWNGATVTIKDGNFVGNLDAVYVGEGTLIIEGGTFSIQQLNSGANPYGFTLNCLDDSYKSGTAKIIVRGGSFFNFDPSNNVAEGAGTNFVAPGYKVISEARDGGTWYTVVPE